MVNPSRAETPRPSWRGRLLPRPEEELVDQGLAFDIRTLLDRRNLLRGFGLGTLAVGLAACGDDTTTTSSSTPSSSAAASSTTSTTPTTTTAAGEIPDETAGPYPGDGSNGPDVLDQSGIVRSDIRSSFGDSSGTAAGVPMTLELTLSNLADPAAGFAGAAVYVWHCDREGRYSMYSDGVEDQNYLRGVQVADAAGVVRFTSIFPACYSGRWPHIHFEVYPDVDSITDAATVIATSQVALPQDVCDTVYATTGYEASVSNLSQVSLASDGIFGDDGGELQLAAVIGDVTSGYAVSLPVAVDTTTTPTSGSMGGGMGGMGGGRGGPPPS